MGKTLENPSNLREISERLKNVSEQSVRQWGRMSTHEMLCHLSDSFVGLSGRGEVPSVANFWSRTIIKWMALRVPLKWPKGVPTVPEVDPQRNGTKPVEFARDHKRLEKDLESFVHAVSEGRCGEHPFFGPLSKHEWLRWGYLHADHHLRQFGH